MKKILSFGIVLFLFSIGYCQEIEKDYYVKMKLMTKSLDSTKFKNNILYDRVHSLAKLKDFNQNQRIDTSSAAHFKQAIHELNFASNKSESLLDFDDLKQIIYNGKDDRKVLIGIINYDFTVLKNDAISSENPSIQIDSTTSEKKYFEIINKNPYENKQCLVISTLEDNIYQYEAPIIFSFKNAFFEKTINPIENLFLNFGEGQTVQVISNKILVNEDIPITFSTSGTKNITYSGNYVDGTTFLTKSRLNVNVIITNPSSLCTSAILKIRSDEIFVPYEYDTPTLPSNASSIIRDGRPEIEYRMYYGNSDCVLRKPILILDGIDYGDVRGIDQIYDASLVQSDNPNLRLGERLRNLGYDVVIANFPIYKIAQYQNPLNNHEPELVTRRVYRDGGADYIQRNAKAIKKLIKNLNLSLTTNNSTQKLIVVGPSMGGIVSRWALKELEDEGYNHNTKLWVSFDSPHQGANIPLSVQYLAEFGSDGAALDKLNRPATKQLLIHHYTNGSTATGGAPNFRQRFNEELSNLCYPINNIRKIALVNGTATGTMNNSPGQLFADIHIWMSGFPYGNAAFGNLNLSNSNGVNQVFKMRVRDGLFNWNEIHKYVSSSGTVGSYDTAPGCKFSLTGNAAIGGYINPPAAGFLSINLYGRIDQYVNNFTFMATKSTVDFKGNNLLLQEPFNNRNLVTTLETPFDAYYTPVNSEEHVELNTANVNWLLNEINTTQNTNVSQNIICGVRPTSLEITGSNNLCDVFRRTYTLVPNNLTNVQWTTVNLNVVSSNNQNITVYKNNPNQASYLTAIHTSGGGTIQASRTLLCNRPYPRFNVGYQNNVDIKVKLEDTPNEAPLSAQNLTNVEWIITSGNGHIISYDNIEATISGTEFTGTVTGTNEDGQTYTKNFFWPDPNNCKAITKIDTNKYQIIDRCNNNSIVSDISEKDIYNLYGYKIDDLSLNNQNINLNIGNSGDIQIIHVISDGENLTKRIIKD